MLSPAFVLGLSASLSVGASLLSAQQEPPPNYRTRRSACRFDQPQGTPLELAATVSAVKTDAYTAEKVTAYATSAARLSGGEIVACTEYGRVEIADSDDDKVRVQVRLGASGDGTSNPPAAARRAIEETTIRVYAYAAQGRLIVHVWNDTLGFTAGTAQPVNVGIRIHVPASGSYRVTTEAYHGSVAVRRLAVSGGIMLLRSAEKFKGIPGYLGTTELDNILLGGDLRITSDGGALSAPLLAKMQVIAPSTLTVTTGADINIAVAPEPTLGVRAFGASNDGAVNILLGDAARRDTTVSFSSSALLEQPNFAVKALRLDVRATTVKGKVNIASVPAAPPP